VLVRLSAPELASQRTEVESKLSGDDSTVRRLTAAAGTPGAVAQHDVELATASLKADQARVKALRSMEQYLIVRAPFDGMVTERNVHPGALVGPPSGGGAVPMLRLEDARRLRLTVALPEGEVGAIAQGAPATFSVRAWPGQRFTAIIRRPARTVDARTRTMAVELDVDNSDRRLAPGMYAEVSWPVRRSGDSLFVPVRAIVQTPDKSFVARVRNGIVEQVPVQRGIAMDERVEIFGELRAGDKVVAVGSESLKDGTRVKERLIAAASGK
jgi:RND family efflux transporter MFP subunit